MGMQEALVGEIQNWLRRHYEDVNSPGIRAYLKQWAKAQESDGFALKARSRGKYFLHLLDFPRTYGEIMTRRHCVYSYLRAFAALFLGYHPLYVLNDLGWRRKALLIPSVGKTSA